MDRFVIPATRGEGDFRPDGSYCVNNAGVGIETDRGRLPLPPGDTDVRYPALAADRRIAGQPQTRVRGAWVWDPHATPPQWTTDPRIPAAPNSTIYDDADVLHVNQLGPGYVGSNGYRYIAPDGSIVSGDATYAAIHHVAEWIDLSDAQDRSLLIGYADWALLCIVWDGTARVNRLLEPGMAYRLRARRSGEAVAIAITHADGCVLLQTTRAELRTLPIVAPGEIPEPIPPTPEPQPPIPIPVPPEPTPPIPSPVPEENAAMAASQVEGVIHYASKHPSSVAGLTNYVLPDGSVFSCQSDGSAGSRPAGTDGPWEQGQESGSITTFNSAGTRYTWLLAPVDKLPA